MSIGPDPGFNKKRTGVKVGLHFRPFKFWEGGGLSGEGGIWLLSSGADKSRML